MEQSINLSTFDRALIAGLTKSNNRLAAALELQKDEKVYSCKEAAEVIGVTPQSISRYVRQGRLRKAVRGGRVGIPESEIRKIKPQ